MNVYLTGTDIKNEVVVDLMARLMGGGARVFSHGDPGLGVGKSALEQADVLIVLLDEEWSCLPPVVDDLEYARTLIRGGSPLRGPLRQSF